MGCHGTPSRPRLACSCGCSEGPRNRSAAACLFRTRRWGRKCFDYVFGFRRNIIQSDGLGTQNQKAWRIKVTAQVGKTSRSQAPFPELIFLCACGFLRYQCKSMRFFGRSASQGDLLPNSSRAARPYSFPQPLRWLVPCCFPSCVIQRSLLFPWAGADPE